MPVEILGFGFADAAMDALVMVQIWDMVKAEVGEGADQQLKLHCINICRPSNGDSSEGADAKRRALSVNTAKPCELWLFHSPNRLPCHDKESSPMSQAPKHICALKTYMTSKSRPSQHCQEVIREDQAFLRLASIDTQRSTSPLCFTNVNQRRGGLDPRSKSFCV